MVIDAFSCGVAAGSRSSAVNSAVSLPPTPLSPASTITGSVPCFSRSAAIAASRAPAGSAPSDAASCSRTSQSPSSRRRKTFSWIVAGADVSQRSESRSPASRTSRAGSVSAFFTSPMSSRSSPSSVHSACSRTRSSEDDVASLTSAGATVTSPRSTSIRCAVSRHQPLACESRLTSCAEVSGLAGVGAAVRVESWTMR